MQYKWIRCGFYTLCLTLFLLPFNPVWSRYSSALFLTFGLLAWLSGFRSISGSIKPKLYLILPFTLYFILHLINYNKGDTDWKLIERQLFFLLGPLLGYPVFRESFSKKNRRSLIIAYTSGITTATLFLLIRALLIHFEIVQPEVPQINSIDAFAGKFMASALSYFQHPSYFSMGINLAIIVLVLYGKELNLPAVFISTVILFFTVIIILLSSQAGLAGLIVTAVILIIMRLRDSGIRKSYVTGSAAFIVFIFFIFLITNPALKNTVSQMTENVKENGKLNLGAIEPRANVWSSAITLISDRFLSGYGIGEGRRKLVNDYRNNGYYSEAFFNLNCHNQFLETQLAFGLIGTMVLITMIFGGLYKIKKKPNQQIKVVFILLVIIHFMFESMLVRQWGIMLFTYFFCILNLSEEKDISLEIPSGF